MKKNGTSIVLGGALAAAALTGIFGGSAFADMPSSSGINNTSGSTYATFAGSQAASNSETAGKHDCKGHNECKGHGGCKTGDNGCSGKNSCKGKGGCKTSGE